MSEMSTIPVRTIALTTLYDASCISDKLRRNTLIIYAWKMINSCKDLDAPIETSKLDEMLQSSIKEANRRFK